MSATRFFIHPAVNCVLYRQRQLIYTLKNNLSAKWAAGSVFSPLISPLEVGGSVKITLRFSYDVQAG
jgi:hypothetical protein